MKKFLIINPFGIGDVLFTTPVVAAIRDSFPHSVIGYWCNERVRPILGHNPGIDKIFALARGDIKRIFKKSWPEGIRRSAELFLQIKKEKFDVALDFSLDHRYGLTAVACGIKKRIGFNYKNRGRFLTDRIDIEGYADKHVVEHYLDLLKIISITPKNKKLELFVPQGQKNKAKDMLREKGAGSAGLIIGIAPAGGASWGKDALFKHWPAVKFARLADRIIGSLGAEVLILGDEQDAPIADTMLKAMQNKAINFVGRTSLEELAATVDNVDILVTNDGGPLHIAAALGKRTLSFFGPVDPIVYGPYPPSERHIVLRKVMECSPCYSAFRRKPCRKNKACLEEISIDEAWGAVEKLSGV